MAPRSSSMPDEGVYFVKPVADCGLCCGLDRFRRVEIRFSDAKSMTSMPCAAMDFAVAVMLSVGRGQCVRHGPPVSSLKLRIRS